MLSLVLNKPLLSFPIVKVLDILIARAILEILGSCLMTVLLLLILFLFNVDFMPIDIPQACYALGASVMLGLGMGMINAIIALAFTGWITGYALVIVVLYLSSGVMFVSINLPESIRFYLSFNPLFHAVEWMRSAYYDGYSSLILDKGYLLAWGIGTIFGGLLLERLIRVRLLQG